MSERYVEEQYKVVKSIQASDFATTNDRYDICIKHVEQLQSTSAWLEQEVILGYLQIVQPVGVKSYLMRCNVIKDVLEKGKSKTLDKLDLESFNFLAGPHIINGNHWTAFVVDMPNKVFNFFDPKDEQNNTSSHGLSTVKQCTTSRKTNGN